MMLGTNPQNSLDQTSTYRLSMCESAIYGHSDWSVGKFLPVVCLIMRILKYEPRWPSGSPKLLG